MVNLSQVEIRLNNIDQAKEIFEKKIPSARVKYSLLKSCVYLFNRANAKNDNHLLSLFLWQQTNKQMKKLNKKYADLLRQAQQATGRKEAVGLIHKAAKLKNKFINTKWCSLFEIHC